MRQPAWIVIPASILASAASDRGRLFYLFRAELDSNFCCCCFFYWFPNSQFDDEKYILSNSVENSILNCAPIFETQHFWLRVFFLFYGCIVVSFHLSGRIEMQWKHAGCLMMISRISFSGCRLECVRMAGGYYYYPGHPHRGVGGGS